MDTLERPLWTADSVAAYLSTTPRSVYRWAATGAIPCVRLVGLVRFDPVEVEEWIASRRKTEDVH